MNPYIAYCGLDCESCEARLATITDDDALRARVAALWSALNGAEITPEIYYHEQDRQSRGFQPVFWVDITTVEAEKERIIGFYECQGGSTSIAPNKRLNADFRGRNMHRRAAFAEAYAICPGAPQGARCIFAELPQLPL